MANDFYQHSGHPGTRAPRSSALLRAEFAAIEDGFDKLPDVGTANLFSVSNGSALVGKTAAQAKVILALDSVPNLDTTAAVSHTSLTDNPHSVTKEQVGLDSVPNLDTTAAVAHLALTNNPHSVTKAQVGLGNCDNTSDANKPISTLTQAALNLKANLASPSFTGNPLVPTQAYELGAADSSTKIASTAYVNNRIAELTKLLRGSTWLQMFPSGLLLQVGLSLASSTAGGEMTVMFPQPYWGSAPFVLVSGITDNTATNSCWVTATDIMFFKFRASLASQNITWLAFGYTTIGDDV